MAIRKAVIPAAGFGTRLLPATKSVPKEMLPVAGYPAIDYAVRECVESGVRDICIIVSRGKESILDYFDRTPELEEVLKKGGRKDALALIGKFYGVNFTYIRQAEMRGTGSAIELCKEFAAGEPFAVLFPDDIVFNPSKGATGQLIEAFNNTRTSIVGVQKLPREEAGNYGIVDVEMVKGRYVGLKGLIEKPAPEAIPEVCYASLGRFILTPDIFDYIAETKPAKNGEIYLPSAIDLMAKSVLVCAYEFEGAHYDVGSADGLIIANVDFALRDERTAAKVKKHFERLKINGFIPD